MAATIPAIFAIFTKLTDKPQGCVTNMVNAVGTTAYSYDSVSELMSESGPWARDRHRELHVRQPVANRIVMRWTAVPVDGDMRFL